MRLAALYTLLVFVSLYFAPAVRDFLAHHRLLAGAVSAVYVVLGLLGVVLIFHKYRIRKPAPTLLFFGLFLVFLSVFSTVELLIERLHLLEYALMFAFWFRALRHFAASTILCHGATLLACGILGTVDEVVQYLLPNRYFDLQDIFLNVTGALFGMGVVVIFFRYRWDRGES